MFDCNVKKRLKAAQTLCTPSVPFYFAHCESAYFLYKIGQSRDTLTADKTCIERTGASTCETAANEVITLGIMLDVLFCMLIQCQ